MVQAADEILLICFCRLLAAAIGLEPLPESAKDRASLRSCADNLNTRHRNAQLAGRASVEVYTLLFFLNRDVVADARVIKVKGNGLVVFVPKYGIEGPVYLISKDKNNRAEEHFVLDEDKQTVSSVDGATRFTIFDKCAVRISIEVTMGHRRQLVLGLVSRDEIPEGDRIV